MGIYGYQLRVPVKGVYHLLFTYSYHCSSGVEVATGIERRTFPRAFKPLKAQVVPGDKRW